MDIAARPAGTRDRLRYPRDEKTSLGASRARDRPYRARARALARRGGRVPWPRAPVGADAPPDRGGTPARAVLRADRARLVSRATAAHANAQSGLRRRASARGARRVGLGPAGAPAALPVGPRHVR